MHLDTHDAHKPDLGDDYTANTRTYDYLKSRGWLIHRGAGNNWTVSNGMRSEGGFIDWVDALAWAVMQDNNPSAGR